MKRKHTYTTRRNMRKNNREFYSYIYIYSRGFVFLQKSVHAITILLLEIEKK